MAEPSGEVLSVDRKEEIQTRVPAPLPWHPSFLKELKVWAWAWSARWILTVTWLSLFRLSCCKYRVSFTFYGIKCGKLTTDVSNQERWGAAVTRPLSSSLSHTPDPADKNEEENVGQAEELAPLLF